MNRLKELRNEYNLSVRALEGLINIGSTAITLYELESRDFNTNGLKTFSDFFCVSIDYLLCHSNEGIFVYYEHGNKYYRLDDFSFKKYKNEGLIYYKDYKRYLDINRILNVKKETNVSELLEFINEQDAIKNKINNIDTVKLDIPFDKVSFIEKVIKLDDDKFLAIKKMIEFL